MLAHRKLERLIEARKRAKLTQEAFGKALGIPAANVSGWENLTRAIPMQHWDTIARILSITYDDVKSIAQEAKAKIYGDDREERIGFILNLSQEEYCELVNAYESKRLDLFQIAKIDDIEDFRDRAVAGIARMNLPAETKGMVIDFLSKLDGIESREE